MEAIYANENDDAPYVAAQIVKNRSELEINYQVEKVLGMRYKKKRKTLEIQVQFTGKWPKRQKLVIFHEILIDH